MTRTAMHPFGAVLPFADAVEMVMSRARPIERRETVALTAADGRVLASDLKSAVDVPPFDRAAMDGYAVIAADLSGAAADAPCVLACVARVYTGEVPTRAVTSGTCIEVATGAPMPAGADAVVMVEETTREGDRVAMRVAARPRQNIGPRAADIASGATVLGAGQTLTPSRIGALAAIGTTSIDVYAKPTVAILSTGNEIIEPGRPLAPGQIYDINRFTLQSVVARHGGIGVPLRILADTLDDLVGALDAAAAHDIVVFSGGSSVGTRDLMIEALRARGTVHFHGVAVKPGKPTAFAHVGDTPVFGMPGYPTSCLSNAYMLLVPFLRHVARLPPWRPETMRGTLTRRISSVPDRHQFYTVRIVEGGIEPAFKSSGDITSMAQADGYIEIPAGVERVDVGDEVVVRLFG